MRRFLCCIVVIDLRKKFPPLGLLAVVCAAWTAVCADIPPVPAPATTVITNAALLRALPPEVAATKVPVKLTAIVTTITPNRTIFIQDATGGTFLTSPRVSPEPVEPGDRLAIEGDSFAGLYLPGIVNARFKIIGHGDLPAASKASFDDLLSARMHYQRVELAGVVRSLTKSPGDERYVLILAVGSRKLEVLVDPASPTNLPPLVGAQVTIKGLATGYINDRRQLIVPQLLSRLEDIHIEKPPAADAFALPLTPFNGVMNFTTSGVSHRRVRVRGSVTHQKPGEVIFLQDEQSGLMVQTTRRDIVKPGDVVDAVGFPAMGRFSAFLEDADFRVVGSHPAPMPVPSTLGAVLSGTNDASLVTIAAQLIEILETRDETVLVLQADNTVFQGRLPRTDLTLRNGTKLKLTGVCLVEEPLFRSAGFRANPGTIELLLRSPADIVVYSAPTWWTARRLAAAAAVSLGFGLAALVWVGMLRRRVRHQAGVIREKVQREATLEERHRMAREMHDTLAQSFSGLGFQLDALDARLPTEAAAARSQLETARQIVRHGQEDFRRSLMNLRAQELERGSLIDALPEVAKLVTHGTGIELSCKVEGVPRQLADDVENHLLRIGQECVTNAVRHAEPKHIEVVLTFDTEWVRLRITDDGKGFNPETPAGNGGDHFGLSGIEERAKQIRATVAQQSKPGKGTTITIILPSNL